MKRASQFCRRACRTIWGLAWVVVYCACSVSAPPLTAASYADYVKLSSQLTCEAMLRCCGSVCSSASDATYLSATARTLDYIAQGQIGYDRDAAESCLTAMSQRLARCDTTLDQLPSIASCDKVLTPLTPAGGICEVGITSCISDTTCISGRCVALPKLGQACPISTSCASGFYCNRSIAPVVCTKYLETGQVCTTPAGVMCNPTESLLCLPTTLCGLPQENGAACLNNNQCKSMFCSASVCAVLPAPAVQMTLREQLCTATATPK